MMIVPIEFTWKRVGFPRAGKRGNQDEDICDDSAKVLPQNDMGTEWSALIS